MNIRILFAALAVAACPLAAQAQETLTVPAAPPAVAAPLAAAIPGAVTLRYKFVPGQVRRYKMVMDMTMTMQMAPSAQGIPITSHSETVMRQTIKDVRPSDGAATLTLEIESLSTMVNGSPVQMPAEQQARMKQPSTMVMTPTGKILSVQLGGLPPGGLSGGMPGMDFSKGFMNGNYGLPENPVHIGESWSGSANSGMAGVQMDVHSTLQKLDTSAGTPGIAEIAQSLNGTLNMDMGKTSPIPMKMTGSLTGTGTQHFDASAGAIAGQDMTMQAAINMVIGSAGSQSPSGAPRAMHMKMQMHMKMDRLTDTPAAPSP